MPFGKGLGGIPETPKGIGVGFGVAAKSMSESRRKFQWMETRKRNHARANLHGSTRQLAWMDSRKCMVGLSEVHGCASGVAWMDFQSAIWAPKRHTQHPAPPKSQPPRQEVLRVLVPRQVQHPRHSGEGVNITIRRVHDKPFARTPYRGERRAPQGRMPPHAGARWSQRDPSGPRHLQFHIPVCQLPETIPVGTHGRTGLRKPFPKPRNRPPANHLPFTNFPRF